MKRLRDEELRAYFKKKSYVQIISKTKWYIQGPNVSNFIGSDQKVAPYQLFVFR